MESLQGVLSVGPAVSIRSEQAPGVTAKGRVRPRSRGANQVSTADVQLPILQAPSVRAPGRVLPISSIRFVLAAWVALGHFGIPVLQEPQQGHVLWAVRALVNNAVSGQAA